MNHIAKPSYLAEPVPVTPLEPALAEMPPGEAPGWRGALRRAVPMLSVFLALGGLAIWGHHTGWTMPKFSALTGHGEQQSDDWCQEHDVPESLCVACNTRPVKSADVSANTITLSIVDNGKPQDKTFQVAKDANVTVNGHRKALSDISRGMTARLVLGDGNEVVEINATLHYGFCKKHGVHDCPWEHPDVGQVAPTPKITEADLARAERALKLTDRPANGHGCTRHEQVIQFASQKAFVKLGIGEFPVFRTPIEEAITANGEVTYDQTRLVRLPSRTAGIVWRVEKKVGDDVREGELLALIDSAEVGRARTAYVQALVQLDLQTKTLARLQSAGEVVEGKRIIAAEAALQEARVGWLAAQQALANLGLPLSADDLKESRLDKIAERLQFLGLPKSVAQKLKSETVSGNLVPVTAPLGGRIVARNVVQGDVIDTAKMLFMVADVRRMWLTLDVSAEDVKLVRVGQPVSFRAGGKKYDAAGKVSWISTEADERTRTVKVRVDLENLPDQDYPDGRLRANTFGTGRIILREEKDALVASNEALHWEGCCWVVFVRDNGFTKEEAPKVFHVRKVRLGAKDGDNTEIIAGVLEGEMLATTNSGVLRSALLKNSLGAG